MSPTSSWFDDEDEINEEEPESIVHKRYFAGSTASSRRRLRFERYKGTDDEIGMQNLSEEDHQQPPRTSKEEVKSNLRELSLRMFESALVGMFSAAAQYFSRGRRFK